MPPASEQEVKILSRITEIPSGRHACQLHPTNNVEIAALVKLDAGPDQAARRSGYRQDREMNVAFLFLTCSDLPNYLKNAYPLMWFYLKSVFAELAEALLETNGHYAQFFGTACMLSTAYQAPQNKAVLNPYAGCYSAQAL